MPRPTLTARSEPVFPTEVRLLLILCRYPVEDVVWPESSGEISDAPSSEVLRLCSAVADWDRFLQLARHHRVMSLVAKHAATRDLPLPTPVSQALRASASANAVEAFRSLAETQRLLSLLAAAGIVATVLKGVPLSLMAFGGIATRDVGDIDLLIVPEEADTADRILLENGFRRSEPVGKLTPKRRASYAKHFKDYTYEPIHMQSQGGFEIDLHWRLFRNPLLPGNELTQVDPEITMLGSIQLQTLSRPTQLLYLSVQGAVDGWTQLKAVADIAALWNASDRAAILELARDAEVLPYLFAALLLAEGWIGGIDLPEGFNLEKCLDHPITRTIVSNARQKMHSCAFLPALRDSSSWSMKRYEASLHGTLDYKRGIVRRVLFRPRVWTRFDLPDPLFFLYPLLSPIEWLLFHLGKHRGSASEKHS